MKTRLLFTFGIFLFLIGFDVPAFAQSLEEPEHIWPPMCTGGPPPVKCPPYDEFVKGIFHDSISKPFDQSDNVLVGTILQIENNTENALTYTVDVDFYLKNIQSFDLITATLDNPVVPDHAIYQAAEIQRLNSPFFDENDLVFLYLDNDDGQYKVLPQSFVIEKSWRHGTPRIVQTNPHETIFELGNDVLFSGIIQKTEMYQAAKKDKPLELRLTIYDQNKTSVFSKQLNIDADATYQYKFQTSNYPAGKYEYEMRFEGGSGGTIWDGEITIKSDRTYMTPLKQHKTGVSFAEIRCEQSLILIQKYDDSPACVKLETKDKLIERGWTDEKVRDSDNPLQQKWTYNTNGEISSIDISEDDSTIVIGTKIRDTQKGMLYVLDDDGMILWKKEFDSMIGHVDISNDVILVKGFHLCGGGGGAITYCNYVADVFDINGKKKQSYTHEDTTAFSASLSPEGSSVITNTYDTLKYFNLNENKSWTHVPDKYIEWATFLTGSEIIVNLDNTGEIFALDNTGNKIWNFTTIHQNSYSYAISNDGKYFVISDDTSPDDGNIYLLNSDGTLLWQDNIGDTVLHLAFSGDASRILVEINGAFMVYDIDGNLLWKNNIPSDLTMSSDGSFLVGTTFNQGSGANITLFDGSGNILSNYPVSNESLSSIFALGNNDDYLVMANDTNKLVMFETSPNFDDVAYDLTTLRNSDDLHVKVVPTDTGLFDVAIANGGSVEIPWDVKFDQGYTRSNFDVSIASESDIGSWITPTSPYTTINGVPPGEKIITIHVMPDAATGNHAVKILGRGDTVHNQTGWMTNLDGKTLGTVNVSVIPKQDSLSIKTGKVHSERGTFCVDWKSGGGTACTGLVTYQKMPITVFSNVSQTVTLDATTIQKGGWIKFVPEKLVASPNGTSSDMLMAGYLIPFKSNPSAEKSLIIEASSETESTTTVIPIRFGTISVINDEPSSIILGKIKANSNGTYYSISNAVYDPLKDDSADFVLVTLSILGLWKDGNVSDLPDWLSVNIPKQSFVLNATKPHHFMIVAQTDNAPVSGTYHIAINENINGENFTELQELVIENRRY